MDGWMDAFFIATHQIFVEPFHSTLFKISSFINKRSETKEVEWLANIVMSMDNVASNYISASVIDKKNPNCTCSHARESRQMAQ